MNKKMKKFRGTGVSPGIAIGPARRLSGFRKLVAPRESSGAGKEAQLKRLEKAFLLTGEEIDALKKKLVRQVGRNVAEILNVQSFLLKDRNFWQRIEKEVESGHEAPKAVELAVASLVERFEKIEDNYLKERRQDVEDLGRRIVHHLLGGEYGGNNHGNTVDRVIIVAPDLSPSETASLSAETVAAFVTDMGGPTSHTAIMARALEIPAVVGLREISGAARPGDTIIVDGREGLVVIDPDEAILEKYRQKQAQFEKVGRELMSLRNRPAVTLDGHRLLLGANIEKTEEIASVLSHGADEIGLFRTEFLYLNRDDLPSEEEQYKAYREVISGVAPRPVTIRTLDLGGDKFASGLDIPEEGNPFLGWRGIRFCLAHRDIFRSQLRAILRAAFHGNARIMYPLVTDICEIREANRVLDTVKSELRSEGVDFNDSLSAGAMIEVPAAALQASTFAGEAAFFSVGSNDLIQYALAVDRGNENTSYLYNPLHPSVLKLVDNIIRAGHEAGIKVGVCGEMAADPMLAFLLAGMGVDGLSMASLAIPEVKQNVLRFSLEEAGRFAREICSLDSAGEIESRLRKKFKQIQSRSIPPVQGKQ